MPRGRRRAAGKQAGRLGPRRGGRSTLASVPLARSVLVVPAVSPVPPVRAVPAMSAVPLVRAVFPVPRVRAVPAMSAVPLVLVVFPVLAVLAVWRGRAGGR